MIASIFFIATSVTGGLRAEYLCTAWHTAGRCVPREVFGHRVLDERAQAPAARRAAAPDRPAARSRRVSNRKPVPVGRAARHRVRRRPCAHHRGRRSARSAARDRMARSATAWEAVAPRTSARRAPNHTRCAPRPCPGCARPPPSASSGACEPRARPGPASSMPGRLSGQVESLLPREPRDHGHERTRPLVEPQLAAQGLAKTVLFLACPPVGRTSAGSFAGFHCS